MYRSTVGPRPTSASSRGIINTATVIEALVLVALSSFKVFILACPWLLIHRTVSFLLRAESR